MLPYVFKRFSVLKGLRTGLPTCAYYIRRKPLPESDKPALFTMNILPPMMTVWYHFVRKYLGNRVDIVIFDSSGKLNPKDFPHARVHKFLNLYAATKSNEFLYHIAKKRKIGWICDDDMFPMSSEMVDLINEEFSDPKTASLSFRSRNWWHFNIDGKEHPVSSSYCTVINREIFCDKEKLNLSPADGNDHPSDIGKPPGRYDTFDKANEILIRNGYRCAVVPEERRKKYLTGFTGVSGAVMLLNYFKKPEQVLDYYLKPEKECWSGNMLFGTLAAMLSICTIQELYTKLKGKPYPLPSLPERNQLEQILEDHKQYLREDQNIDFVTEASERLKSEL